MTLIWDFALLADRLGGVVDRAEAESRLEQAVYGLDARTEVQLQQMLADGLTRQAPRTRPCVLRHRTDAAGVLDES